MSSSPTFNYYQHLQTFHLYNFLNGVIKENLSYHMTVYIYIICMYFNMHLSQMTLLCTHSQYHYLI